MSNKRHNNEYDMDDLDMNPNDSIGNEEGVGETQERTPEAEIEDNETGDPLAEANEQIAELKDKYLRIVAEFDNYKKRTLKEKSELILNGSAQTVTAILPVLDDFERAIANGEKTNDVKALKEGMEIIFKNFKGILRGLGVSKIDTDGQDFNVDYHEAVAMIPGVPDNKKGKVVDCVQTGYTLNDKVIRHAKVAVGQ